MFSILMTVFWAIPHLVQAQEPCQIECDASMPVCNGTTVVLSVPNNPYYLYNWIPGDYNTSTIRVRPTTTTTYHLYVTDTVGEPICDNSFTVEVWPPIRTSMRQLQLTCSNNESDNGRTAQIKVNASEGLPPYTYSWEYDNGYVWKPLSSLYVSPTDPTVAIGLKAYKWYRVKVTDDRGCVKYDSIYTRAFLAPKVEIYCDPCDTVYIQNPDVSFSFENLSADTLGIDHFFWTFEHDITSTQESPVFTYVETGEFYPTLTIYDDLGCDTVYMKQLHVNPVKLKIPSVFTPNGDGVNDTFVITLSSGSDTPGTGSENRNRANSDERPLNDYYKSTELMVMNRWGRVVYHSTNYNNDWDGDGLSDGTYFYILKCRGLKEEIQYQGSVMIIKKSRQ